MTDDFDNITLHTDKGIRDMILGLNALVKLDNRKRIPAIHLDNAATTPPFQKVAQDVRRQLICYSSIGRGRGQKSAHSTALYTEGRNIVKDFVGANSDLYTAFYVNGTTDGINKLASALIENPENIVLSTRMEHHANDLPWRNRAKMVYAEVDDNGRLMVEDIERLLNIHQGRIRYVTVTAASNVTGYVNDVHAIAKIAHQHGAQMIVDGAQIVAHRAFSMLGQTPEENIDFFVFSAHKMYSPFGSGAVVGLAEVLNQHVPAFYGGGMVESVCDHSVRYLPAPGRYEAGSPNYTGVIGMLRAMKILKSIGFDYIHQHEQRLLERTLNGLQSIPGVILYGDCENIHDRVGIVVFNLSGIDPEDVAGMLADRHAIAVRHAGFCAHPYVRRLAREMETGVCSPPKGMVRISFGIYNDERDVDHFLAAIREWTRCNTQRTFAGNASMPAPELDLPCGRG